MRKGGLRRDELRPVGVELGIQRNPEGSLIYRSGGTSVLIAASVEQGVKDFLRGSGKGWVTAEYEMHPRANPRRQQRERSRSSLNGRTQEIQRLIGRALRGAVVPEKLGERTISIDCDVLDADGGTRTASITGGFIALCMALDVLRKGGAVHTGVVREQVVAVSVGMVDGEPTLDLCYEEDRDAQVDLNVVATASGAIVEVQGTAEGAPIPRSSLDSLIDLALSAVPALCEAQSTALARKEVRLDWLLGSR